MPLASTRMLTIAILGLTSEKAVPVTAIMFFSAAKAFPIPIRAVITRPRHKALMNFMMFTPSFYFVGLIIIQIAESDKEFGECCKIFTFVAG